MKSLKLYARRSEDMATLLEKVNKFSESHQVVGVDIFKDFDSNIRGTNTLGYLAIIKTFIEI